MKNIGASVIFGIVKSIFKLNLTLLRIFRVF